MVTYVLFEWKSCRTFYMYMATVGKMPCIEVISRLRFSGMQIEMREAHQPEGRIGIRKRLSPHGQRKPPMSPDPSMNPGVGTVQ